MTADVAHPPPLSLQAMTPIDALRIRKKQFLDLLTDFPEVTIAVIRVLAERLSQTNLALTEERSKSLKE